MSTRGKLMASFATSSTSVKPKNSSLLFRIAKIEFDEKVTHLETNYFKGNQNKLVQSNG